MTYLAGIGWTGPSFVADRSSVDGSSLVALLATLVSVPEGSTIVV